VPPGVGVGRARRRKRRLSEALVLAWADAHRRRTGHWPAATSGPVAGSPGETWGAVDKALRHGRRGLAGGDSLPRLLLRERGLAERRGRPAGVDRQCVAVLLRARGLTLAQVGRELGVSRQRAHQLLGQAEAAGRRHRGRAS
jgi:hypothetical protein